MSGVAYALMVVSIWGSYAFTSGLPSETVFPHASDVQGWSLKGFLFPHDFTRIHTATFYHIAYLAADLAGVPGAYASYQIVYAILWWARGLLVFLVLRRLFPGQVLLPYAAGALCLVHATDHAFLWVGQLNQQGFMFWMMLAFYFFVASIQAETAARAVSSAIAAGLFAHMSLWSYESPLPLILVFPLLVLALHRPIARRAWWISAGWYVVPAVYMAMLGIRYFVFRSETYQKTVMRPDLSVAAWLTDWIFNARVSLTMATRPINPTEIGDRQALLLAGGAAAAFLAGALVLARVSRSTLADRGVAGKVLVGGVVLLLMSFPAYLVLTSSRDLWRTQMLSGIGAAMVVASATALVCSWLPRRLSMLVFWGAGTAVVCYAGFCGVLRGDIHRLVWKEHRLTMAAVLRAAPQVAPRTMIVLIAKGTDPLGSSYWWDMAVRVAYPGTPVTGAYYLDGLPGPDNFHRLRDDRWRWENRVFDVQVADARLSETIVLEFKGRGIVTLVFKLPPYLCESGCSPRSYDPVARIVAAKPSVKSLNRYGPL